MHAFLKEQGYVWESDLAGHYTYGPRGCELKRNIEAVIRKLFQNRDFLEIDAPLILSREVLTRSGHWNRFQDPIVKTIAGKVRRLDHLVDYNGSIDKVRERLSEYNNNTPSDPVIIPDEIEYRDLMMKTTSGSKHTGLRPETATATFMNFSELYRYNGQRFPIKVFQIGKSFRNELSPRNSIIRTREFTQAEFQIIQTPKERESCAVWLEHTKQLLLTLGIPAERIRVHQHSEQERAFYAIDAWDLEVELQGLGWIEVAGIHDRGQHDLKGFGIKTTPWVLEIAIGIDRLMYSILDTLYENKLECDGKSILKIPAIIASTQIAVFPLVKANQGLVDCAARVYNQLRGRFRADYSEKGPIGKRYFKASINGTPFCVTIDSQSLQDSTVTVRDRDTEQQVRVPILELDQYFEKRLFT